MKPTYPLLIAALSAFSGACDSVPSASQPTQNQAEARMKADPEPDSNPLAALDQTKGGAAQEAAQTPQARDAQAAFECFSKIDQEELKRTTERGQRVKLEIAELCRQGNRAQAEATLVKFQEESADDESVKALKECGSQLKNALPSKLVTLLEIPPVAAGKHVCDDYSQAASQQ